MSNVSVGFDLRGLTATEHVSHLASLAFGSRPRRNCRLVQAACAHTGALLVIPLGVFSLSYERRSGPCFSSLP